MDLASSELENPDPSTPLCSSECEEPDTESNLSSPYREHSRLQLSATKLISPASSSSLFLPDSDLSVLDDNFEKERLRDEEEDEDDLGCTPLEGFDEDELARNEEETSGRENLETRGKKIFCSIV